MKRTTHSGRQIMPYALRNRYVVASALALATMMPVAVATAAPSETVLHRFDSTDGAFPDAGLILDTAGNLYGTTSNGGASNNGTVFELSPPAAGKTGWTRRTLHYFQGGADGLQPMAGLVFDGMGNLYGTSGGGAYG